MLKTTFAKTFYLCNSFLLVTTSFPSNLLVHGTHEMSMEKKALSSNDGLKLNSPAKHNRGHEVDLSANGAKSRLNKPQLVLNKKGMLYVKKYIDKRNDCLSSVKKRSQVPFYIIDSVFTQYGLPVELKYLAVIESELKPSATSQVGAKGPWQFMPETAQILGLKVTRQCDERSNYYKSTIAAAKYLRDLYALFDDWLLVLAAYNGGPKPVYKAIRESGSRNFWVLQDYLPAESREHVKKFIATHYYFEGRGSETTLTKAENAAFKKKINTFAKTLRAPKVKVMDRTGSCVLFAVQKDNVQETMFGLNLISAPEDFVPGKHLLKTPQATAKAETPDEKFKRLMKESEESLKNARKIM